MPDNASELPAPDDLSNTSKYSQTLTSVPPQFGAPSKMLTNSSIDGVQVR